MNTEKFERIINAQIDLCREVLIEKARQYATADRLHNFKVAAELQGTTPMGALAGMMAKHTVSVYDLIGDSVSGEAVPTELWSEKITDSINYLLLLRALVEEEECPLDYYTLDTVADELNGSSEDRASALVAAMKGWIE